MENASKALIIAGAILISILLISVGIIIMNAINDPVQQGADSAASQAIEIFNSKFTGYMGTDMDYNTTKQLITTITSVNGTLDGDREITYDGAVDSVADLDRTQTYDIDMSDGVADDGYYDTCTINVH